MEFLFAPMEGITFASFRALHHRMFPGVTEYYTPFIAPDTTGSFKPKYLKELTADSLSGAKVIPQILANRPGPFLVTAGKLHALGFSEIDLNAGCPSATVFAKHKGAGMLTDLDAFDAFLDQIFSAAGQQGYRISIKTRMGVHSTSEFSALLEIYNRYPLSRLIIHARARDGFYESPPDLAAFALAAKKSRAPVTYNGNVFSGGALNTVLSAAGDTKSVMAGRGAVANPALIRTLCGGKDLTCDELQTFHDALIDANLSGGLSPAFTAARMKQLWYYMHCMFPGCRKEHKAILKAKTLPDYRRAASALFSSGRFDAKSHFYHGDAANG